MKQQQFTLEEAVATVRGLRAGTLGPSDPEVVAVLVWLLEEQRQVAALRPLVDKSTRLAATVRDLIDDVTERSFSTASPLRRARVHSLVDALKDWEAGQLRYELTAEPEIPLPPRMPTETPKRRASVRAARRQSSTPPPGSRRLLTTHDSDAPSE